MATSKWLFQMQSLRLPVAALLATTGLVSLILKWTRSRNRAKLTNLRKKKQEERRLALQKLRLIVKQSNMTEEIANVITSLDIADLLAQLRDGDLKSTEVLHAYQLKALLAHQKTNCLVEPIFEAETWAAELDQLKVKGPLHGLPVSIKECIPIKGYDCTAGCAKWIDEPSPDDAVVIKVLKKQGAVPFIKTNIPQTMLSWDSSNPIFGRVLNPHDLTRTSGGSSSGEGALIASGGSICGLGTDIGGSIRIPAAFCGLCGLKPTSKRISKKGLRSIWKGQNNLISALGPLARDVNGLIVLMKGLLDSEMFKLDPSIPVMPFQNEILEENRKLKIGYFDFNGIFEAVPCVVRAVKETKLALEAAGHELVVWDPENMLVEAIDLFGKSLLADAGQVVIEMLKFDEVDDVMREMHAASKLPNFVKRILAFILTSINPNSSKIMTYMCGSKNVAAWWDIIEQTKKLQTVVIESWQKNGLDGIICPALASPALSNGIPTKLIEVATYAGTFNLLDFPAGCIPVTKVTNDDEAAMSSYSVRSKTHAILIKDLKETKGLPVGVQVVTLPWQEEKCLKIMSEIEKAVKFVQVV